MRTCQMLRFQDLAQSCGPWGFVTESVIAFIFRPVYFESVRPYRSSGRQVSVQLLNAETMFSSREVRVGFVMDRVALDEVFLRGLRFFPAS